MGLFQYLAYIRLLRNVCTYTCRCHNEMWMKRGLKNAVLCRTIHYSEIFIRQKFNYWTSWFLHFFGHALSFPSSHFFFALSGPSGYFFCFSGRKISLYTYIYFLVNLGRALGTGGPTTRLIVMSSNLGTFSFAKY